MRTIATSRANGQATEIVNHRPSRVMRPARVNRPPQVGCGGQLMEAAGDTGPRLNLICIDWASDSGCPAADVPREISKPADHQCHAERVLRLLRRAALSRHWVVMLPSPSCRASVR
jgi:hypothetical protein